MTIIKDFIELIYPRLCLSCEHPLQKGELFLCINCLYVLPKIKNYHDNESELDKLFWGRLPLQQIAAFYYYSKGGMVRSLLHAMKYKNQSDACVYIGELFGLELKENNFFQEIDIIMPVPLHYKKQQKRGYNQSEKIADGIASILNIKVDIQTLIRNKDVGTQTKKSGYNRWDNVNEVFEIKNFEKFRNKHILLVDDVITTGSTIEVCSNKILQIPGSKLSVAAIAFASRII